MTKIIVHTCLKCGSKVGSKNDQVLATITTTRPVIITAGTFMTFNIDVLLFVTSSKSAKTQKMFYV